jgi:hypothetical protein
VTPSTQTNQIVARDTWWKGRRYVGGEPFFIARFAEDKATVSRAHLLDDERSYLVTHGWWHMDDLDGLDGRVEPFNLAQVVANLDPAGPWGR